MNYHISQNGQPAGPFPEEEIRRMLATGQAQPTDLCWREGLATWVPLSEVMNVAPPAVLPPSLPPPVLSISTPYAGFWLRAAAFLLDYFVLYIPFALVHLAVGIAADASGATPQQSRSDISMSQTLLAWLYFALMESSALQATLGKLALGIRVCDENGRRIGFGRATGRYFAKFISFFSLGVGFMMAGFTARKQAMHDMIASCLVRRK